MRKFVSTVSGKYVNTQQPESLRIFPKENELDTIQYRYTTITIDNRIRLRYYPVHKVGSAILY
jgi:hypothetical protein